MEVVKKQSSDLRWFEFGGFKSYGDQMNCFEFSRGEPAEAWIMFQTVPWPREAWVGYLQVSQLKHGSCFRRCHGHGKHGSVISRRHSHDAVSYARDAESAFSGAQIVLGSKTSRIGHSAARRSEQSTDRQTSSFRKPFVAYCTGLDYSVGCQALVPTRDEMDLAPQTPTVMSEA
ncbi:hypothetical protein AXG93_3902s1010 [Marchantia polymorpha subsp. ruderalis]|uniref:Uncharacterized protein n=1 Tax=Marchantia polymorpha subsp. ruderalis TaxID=1480154 RepID=A0A176WC23_MARPO|nr:hypothetical protein AXG93_3902s1010 [Marchantia polymorpha subsp. ruderalis]